MRVQIKSLEDSLRRKMFPAVFVIAICVRSLKVSYVYRDCKYLQFLCYILCQRRISSLVIAKVSQFVYSYIHDLLPFL